MLKLVHSRTTAKDKIRAGLAGGAWYYHPRYWTAEYERAIGELIADGEARWGGIEDLLQVQSDPFFHLLPVVRFDARAAWKKVVAIAFFCCVFWAFVLWCVWDRQ